MSQWWSNIFHKSTLCQWWDHIIQNKLICNRWQSIVEVMSAATDWWVMGAPQVTEMSWTTDLPSRMCNFLKSVILLRNIWAVQVKMKQCFKTNWISLQRNMKVTIPHLFSAAKLRCALLVVTVCGCIYIALYLIRFKRCFATDPNRFFGVVSIQVYFWEVLCI